MCSPQSVPSPLPSTTSSVARAAATQGDRDVKLAVPVEVPHHDRLPVRVEELVRDRGGEGPVAHPEQHAHQARVRRDDEIGVAVAVEVRDREGRGARPRVDVGGAVEAARALGEQDAQVRAPRGEPETRSATPSPSRSPAASAWAAATSQCPGARSAPSRRRKEDVDARRRASPATATSERPSPLKSATSAEGLPADGRPGARRRRSPVALPEEHADVVVRGRERGVEDAVAVEVDHGGPHGVRAHEPHEPAEGPVPAPEVDGVAHHEVEAAVAVDVDEGSRRAPGASGRAAGPPP